MNLEGKVINFLGDSITEGVGTSAPENIYHAVLAKNARLKEARNYGISGTRIAVQEPGKGVIQGYEFVDTNSFSERFDQMEDADAVVVFGGTNDYGHGIASLGGFFDKTPETFYGACHYLFRGLVKKYLGKPIVIMTPLHRCGEGVNAPSPKTAAAATLKEYVDIMREVAEFYSLPVLDLFATSGIQPDIPEVRERYMPDGLHPNDAGHAIIAAKLKAFFEQL